MLTSRKPAKLLPRLVIDSVLPCALAAWALLGLMTIHRVQSIDDRAQLAVSLQMQQLANALDRADERATQSLLDASVRNGRDSALQGVGLLGANGRLQHSGRIDLASLERYASDLSIRDGQRRRLIAHVDPAPRRQAQRLVWVTALGVGFGVLLLTWLAIRALQQNVLRPLQRLQRSLSDTCAGTDIHVEVPEAHVEFARLQASSAARCRLLEARGQEATLILRDSRIEALDQFRQSQTALRSKAQFIALVGDHFRQPLQALQLFTGSLYPGIDSEQQAVITQMRSSVADMTRLLDALLELSRLDAEVVPVRVAPISVAELFLRWRAEMSEIARAQAVTLHWHPGAHVLVGDAELIGALLIQLVSNAVAWSPPRGQVLLAARRRGGHIRIEVRDRGPGVAAIHHQRIFEEFVRLHDEGERRQGYGLGLAIAARLARRLQTEIGLHSKPGRGSTFFVEFPCAPAVGTMAPIASTQVGVDDNLKGDVGAADRVAAAGAVSTAAAMPSSERAMS